MTKFTWNRYGGYECSTKGDARFSAFTAVLPDNRTIEQHYQCDVKGYQPGGTNWRLGKGKPPLDKSIPLFEAYVALWEQWAALNPDAIEDLAKRAAIHGHVLSDRFATTPVNQAHALAHILNTRML